MPNIIKKSGTPKQSTAVTTSDSSQSLVDMGVSITTTSTPEDLQARWVIVSVEDAPVRVSLGASATTSKGHLFQIGDIFWLEWQEIPLAEFISATAGSPSTLQVTVEY